MSTETLNEGTELHDGTFAPEGASVVELHDGRFAIAYAPDVIELHDGQLALRGDAVELHDGRFALRGDAVELHDGRFALAYDTVELHDGTRALECDAHECYGNGEYYLEYDMTRWSGHWYSDEWLGDNTFVCERCDYRYHNDTYGGDGLCESCYDDVNAEEEDEEDSDGLLDYGNKSADYLTPSGKGPLFFGIELEVEAKPGVSVAGEVSRVRRSLGDGYVVCKRDGSLGDSGFEIVTRPDTVEVHREKLAGFFSDSGDLTSWASGRCGMHVHLTRSALSQLQVGKMLVFLNHPANTGLVASVAGRTSDRWAKMSPKKISDGKKLSENRYVALNITDKTAEFRIFRGTLKETSFWKNVEFCQALAAYCAPAENSVSDVASPSGFLKFVAFRAKDYPNLHGFLLHRRIYAANRVAVPVKRPEKI